VPLAGTTTAAAARIEPTLQQTAQRESTTVAAATPLDIDTGRKNRRNGVSIELTQASTQ